ncbi:MAG TPA: Ku protein [Nocardioidaceae bacterium]|jgi:DNA end-binding protein Ku
MAQAIWKGSISFGLVTIPVKLYSATEEKDISFRQVHEEDGGRIRYRRVCEIDGEEVPYSDIGKGYEMPDGRMVILTNDDFADLPLPTAKSIEVLEFVPIEQVDPLFFAKAYYLGADGGPGGKPYVLLRDALTKTKQCALVKVAIRTKEVLALLREKEGALVLQTMLWPDEVRDAGFAAPDDSIEIRKQEVEMAESYIATLRADFEPEKFHSDYREALERLVEAKAEGVPVPEVEEDESEPAEVVDLVAALRASVDAAKRRRTAPASGHAPAERGSPTARQAGAEASAKKSRTKKSDKKAAGKKTPAKKSAAKKAAAKKSTAKKSTSKKSPVKKSA